MNKDFRLFQQNDPQPSEEDNNNGDAPEPIEGPE